MRSDLDITWCVLLRSNDHTACMNRTTDESVCIEEGPLAIWSKGSKYPAPGFKLFHVFQKHFPATNYEDKKKKKKGHLLGA